MPVGNTPRTAEDWRGYLVEYGEIYVRTANEYQRRLLTAEQSESHWLGAEPVDARTIEATEQRLGDIRFPPGLRTFLTVTDGWQGVGGWVDAVSPCAEIDWLRNTDVGEDLIELYAEFEEEGEPDELLTLFRRALVIAGGEDLWLLDPATIRPDGEWAAYEFAPKYGEATQYPTFADLFHASKETMIRLAE
jgi:hypothetical protein